MSDSIDEIQILSRAVRINAKKLEDALNNLDGELTKNSDWIPVSERLPESGYCLCCNGGSLPWIAMYHKEEAIFKAVNGDADRPTHHMPLPSAPTAPEGV